MLLKGKFALVYCTVLIANDHSDVLTFHSLVHKSLLESNTAHEKRHKLYNYCYNLMERMFTTKLQPRYGEIGISLSRDHISLEDFGIVESLFMDLPFGSTEKPILFEDQTYEFEPQLETPLSDSELTRYDLCLVDQDSIRVSFTSEWDTGFIVTTPAMYNPKTGRVFDIEPTCANVDGALVREYITLPDGEEIEVDYDRSDETDEVYVVGAQQDSPFEYPSDEPYQAFIYKKVDGEWKQVHNAGVKTNLDFSNLSEK
jgi:hypothetical protein